MVPDHFPMEFMEIQVILILIGMLIYATVLIHFLNKLEKLEAKLNLFIASRGKVHRPTKFNPREIFSAVYDNDLNKLAYLIKVKGLHPESRDPDEYDWTPLMIASRKGYIEIVKFLCQECNVNVNLKDRDGWTALHLAANRNNLDVIKYLIEEQEADPTIRNEGGCTILHIAAYKGYEQLVKYICETTMVDINIESVDNKTARDMALEQGYVYISEYLQQL